MTPPRVTETVMPHSGPWVHDLMSIDKTFISAPGRPCIAALTQNAGGGHMGGLQHCCGVSGRVLLVRKCPVAYPPPGHRRRAARPLCTRPLHSSSGRVRRMSNTATRRQCTKAPTWIPLHNHSRSPMPPPPPPHGQHRARECTPHSPDRTAVSSHLVQMCSPPPPCRSHRKPPNSYGP